MSAQYNEKLSAALLGRRLKPEHIPVATPNQCVISFMGRELGFSEEDVHCNRFYRIILTLSPAGLVRDVRILVDGDLISPCSGYYPEILDQFDYTPVLNHCLTDFQ